MLPKQCICLAHIIVFFSAESTVRTEDYRPIEGNLALSILCGRDPINLLGLDHKPVNIPSIGQILVWFSAIMVLFAGQLPSGSHAAVLAAGKQSWWL